MTLRRQFRWGGAFIILAAGLMNGANIAVYAGYHTTTIQAIYAIGFTGLILVFTIIHIAQAQRAGLFGLLAYLLSVLSLAYANIATFLTLAELAGFEAAHPAFVALWVTVPITRLAVYGLFLGVPLLGMAAARAGVFPAWAGILVALGVALQFPAQFALEIVGPLFFIFTIGGSLLCGAGLVWMGWVLWSGQRPDDPDLSVSPLDRRWGGPFIIFTGTLTAVNAILNNVGELSLLDGVLNLLAFTSLMVAMPILHTVQAQRAGRTGLAGFLCLQLGATISIIPAFLIVAQLAGALATNDALMMAWDSIPVGRVGHALVVLGQLVFGVSVLRAEVFPRWAGWLLVIGLAIMLPVEFVSQAYFFLIFWAIGATLTGAGLAWMGWRVMRAEA